MHIVVKYFQSIISLSTLREPHHLIFYDCSQDNTRLVSLQSLDLVSTVCHETSVQSDLTYLHTSVLCEIADEVRELDGAVV